MKNIPDKIFIQIGDDCEADDFEDLDTGNITWCPVKVDSNDIEYLRSKPYNVLRHLKNAKILCNEGLSECAISSINQAIKILQPKEK